MNDYRLLYKDWITNSEFRDYVGVESLHTTTKMLKRMNLEEVGEKRYRKYIIPKDILDKANRFENKANKIKNKENRATRNGIFRQNNPRASQNARGFT